MARSNPNRLRRAGAATTLFLTLAAALHLTASVAVAGLRADVDAAIRSVDLGGARYSISIRDTMTGRELIGINADAPMIPASNMKLLTTGAALHVLGPGFQYATRLVRNGDQLIVIGDGDPAFGDAALLAEMDRGGGGIDVETFLGFWTSAVVESGMDRVSEVVVDDRIFDREFVHPSWPIEQLNEDYCAEVSGLIFHENILHFFPKPSGGSSAPLVTDFVPYASWLDIQNKASSRTGSGARNSVWIARRHGTNALSVRGNVKHAHRVPVDVTVHDMPEFFAHLLADRLEQAGVQVGGWRVADPSDPASAGDPIGPVITTPLATAVQRCNRESRNLYAEAMLKRVGYEMMAGRPGSWQNGSAIVRDVVYERLGDPSMTSAIVIADGSGMSRKNRVTAEVLTGWLASFAADPELAPIFVESLAQPGGPGTLEKRFRNVDLHGGSVQAKSGYINQVSTLSGYVTMPDGRQCAFSVLVNGLKGTTAPAKRLQERVAAAIAKDLAGRTAIGAP